MNCLLTLAGVHVILLILVLCYAFQKMPLKDVIRKLKQAYFDSSKSFFSRFNGTSFKTEPSSKFSHKLVKALGFYRNSPFVTGSHSSTNGLKTEILDYKERKWIQAKDYPFSNGDR